ncbi:MAG: hypothetical protein K9H26_06475 [Prolixibacteraceae bacterium]|nr:hypothetical protein [Prolixibacteraceae bacterium]
MKKWTIILAVTFLLHGCVEIGEYYVGLNMQPEIEGFEPGLNVYGVIKAGPTFDTINHFFEVERLLNILGTFDSMNVSNANITLSRKLITGETTDYKLAYHGDGRYFNEEIIAAPGEKWDYTCTYDTFYVRSSCIIPNTPKLMGEVNVSTGNSVSFTLEADTTAFMYLVYLLSDEAVFTERKIPVKDEATTFELAPDWNPVEVSTLLFVFAYDQNLEKYTTTSNIFFKPNAYRPPYSTVEGGYGTFGAISSAMFEVK